MSSHKLGCVAVAVGGWVGNLLHIVETTLFVCLVFMPCSRTHACIHVQRREKWRQWSTCCIEGPIRTSAHAMRSVFWTWPSALDVQRSFGYFCCGTRRRTKSAETRGKTSVAVRGGVWVFYACVIMSGCVMHVCLSVYPTDSTLHTMYFFFSPNA